MELSRSDDLSILSQAYPEVGITDPAGYFGRVGDVFGALAYAWLFWPRALEIEGAVFLGLDGDDEADITQRIRQAERTAGVESRMPWPEFVDSFNWFEVAQLFRRWREPREFQEEAHMQLAKFLVPTWSARLAEAFPARAFSVEIVEPDSDSTVAIQVRQVSPELIAPPGWS